MFSVGPVWAGRSTANQQFFMVGLGFCFFRNVYWVVLYVSRAFVQITEFDWVPERQKG